MSVKVVAGESVGLTKHHIVLKDENEVTPVEIRGHWLYVRKCKRAEEMDGILIPEKSRDDTVFVMVLAIGVSCSEPLSKEDRLKYDVKGIAVNTDVNIYDKVLCPDDHSFGIKRSLWGDNEFFIHECIIKGIAEN